METTRIYFAGNIGDLEREDDVFKQVERCGIESYYRLASYKYENDVRNVFRFINFKKEKKQ